MKLKSLSVRGLRVFEDFTFTFPQAAGLYLLTGRNEDYPELGSNGVGKSSLWDTINFVFYGESARRLKGGDLLRDSASMIDAEVETDHHTFHRVWQPSKKMRLLLDGKEVSQEEVVKTIGLDRDMFVTAVIVPQLVPLFCDLPPLAQITVLQRLLGLQRWLDYADKAGKLAAPCTVRAQRMLGEVSALQQQLAHSKVALIETQARGWDTQHAEAVKAAQIRESAAQALTAPHADLATWKAQLATIDTKLARAAHNATVLERRIQHSDRELGVVQGEVSALNAQLKEVDSHAAFLSATPTCPTCRQSITAAHLQACQDERDRLHSVLEADLTIRTNDILRRTQALIGDRQALQAARTKSRELEQTSNALQRQISAEDQRLLFAGRALEEAARARRQVESATNDFTALLDAAQADEQALRTRLSALQSNMAEETRLAEALTFWVGGFKAIRGQLVAEALDQFALEIAAVLEDLGLSAWEIKPLVDPAVFDSGRVQSGFRFDVTPVGGVKRVVDAYSGGELQRARLAIQLGLGGLVADKAGATMEFEVWDEPTSYMSTEGVVGLFTALRGRAHRLQRPIFVIDHHHVDSGVFDAVYTLVRKDGKTELET